MKINCFAILSLLSLVSGSIARTSRPRVYDEPEPLEQKSRVTAFVNTDEGLKVQCWEIGDLLPKNQATRTDGSEGTVRKKMLGNISVTLFSFAPSITLFSFGATGVHSNAVDFRAKPNLFTVKDGLIFIEAVPSGNRNARAREDDEDPDHYVFADVNGDDWFYFEDQTSGDYDQTHCVRSKADPHFTARTISGSETTLINFEYESTPKHTVLHEGRCNFAGLKSTTQSSQSDPDSERFRFRSQDL